MQLKLDEVYACRSDHSQTEKSTACEHQRRKKSRTNMTPIPEIPTKKSDYFRKYKKIGKNFILSRTAHTGNCFYEALSICQSGA